MTGGRTAVGHFTSSVTALLAAEGVELRVAGPAPLQPGQQPAAGKTAEKAASEDVRTLLFIPYSQAGAVTRLLRSVKAASAAKRTDDPVQLRLDGVDVL